MSEVRQARRGKSLDAMKKVGEDPYILCTVARLFWAERKVEKARTWFVRSVKSNKDIGDTWAWWLKFELEHGTPVSTIDTLITLVTDLLNRSIKSKLLSNVLQPIHIMVSSGQQWQRT